MLQTRYAGLSLKNPIIIAASGLTDEVEKIISLEKAGASAVVLKSLLEEQFDNESAHLLSTTDNDHSEAYDYMQHIVAGHATEKYLSLIDDAQQAVSIPVIASINCYDDGKWAHFAAALEEAGADAIELNIQKIDASPTYTPGHLEELLIAIACKVRTAVRIPVTVKMSRYMSNLVAVVAQLRAVGIDGVVLFNRSWQPDIDIQHRRFVPGNALSSPADLSDTLRWLGIVSGQVDLPLAASTGVHSSADVVKSLLAGASAVQVCSALYLHGEIVVKKMLDGLTAWLREQGFSSLQEAVGLLNYRNISDVAYYERLQFIHQFGEASRHR